jgi:hypothetical protein
MDGTRARRIADRFSGSRNFIVQPCSDGLLVRDHNRSHYFVRESCFWSYAYRAAGIPVGDQ